MLTKFVTATKVANCELLICVSLMMVVFKALRERSNHFALGSMFAIEDLHNKTLEKRFRLNID